MEYANQTVQTWDFDHRKRISRIQISAPGKMLENLSYKVDAVGNIQAINENEYTYDGFDRIAGAKTILPGNADKKKLVAKHFGSYKTGALLNGIGYLAEADLNGDGRINSIDHTLASFLSDDQTYDQESFSYDINGNRTKLTQNGDLYTYQYGERNRLEAVYLQRKEAANARLFMKYTYDANGNIIERIIYTDTGEVKTEIEYDTLNRVVRTTEGGKVTEYLYDNVGNRFIKKGPEGTTLYLRHGQIAVAMDIEMTMGGTEDKGKINRYVLSGDLLAGRITQTVKGDGTKEIKTSYYHLDHLNSTKLVSDEDGEVETRYIYRAFGEQLAKLGTGEAKYTYGGKELDNETNLYYFNARYYDAAIGRFISEDPARDGTNWYVYGDNNPLRLVDPTGLSSEKITYTTEVGEGYTIHTTTTKSVTVTPPSDNSRFTIYRTCTHEIETIKILDTPEGKEYANSLNKSEVLSRTSLSCGITVAGFLTSNPHVAIAGAIDAGASLYKAATSSGAAKYEAGDTIIKENTTKITGVAGSNPSNSSASIIIEKSFLIIDKFDNVKTKHSSMVKY